jgi:LuxR family maltose regulon positive regulatory protein
MKTAIFRKISGDKMIYDLQQEITDPEMFEQEVDKMIAILSTWPTRLIIVLDNYQSIDQSVEVERILTKMLSHASPLVTFIITSRIRPRLQLVKLKLQNKLAELERKDLAFTKEEILDFFVNLHHLTLQEHEAELILNKTEGWVASLQLLQYLIKDMNDTDRAPFWLKFSGTPDIYDYLGTEILASQSVEIQNFLYKTSLLTDLNSNVINKFLEIDHSDEILEHLLKSHLFIYKTSLGTIKYHKLFRSFLYKELSKRYNKNEINNYHKQLSNIYKQQADLFNAFAHSVAGSDFLVAAELMKNMKERYDPSQFMVLIDGLLENISPELSSASISLFIARCIPLEIIKELIPPLEINIKNIKEKNNQISVMHLQHQLAALYFYSGEINKSEQLCTDSLNGSIEMKDQEMISINLSLKALICWYMRKYEEAVQFAQKSLSYPDPFGNFHPHHIALWILAEINLEQNHLWKAESLLKETLNLSEQRFDCSIIYPYCSMGKYYRLMGKHQEAFDWIRKAEKLALKFNLGYDLGWIYMELAQTYMETEQWQEADFNLTKSSEYLTHSIYLKSKVKQLQINLWHKMGKAKMASDSQKELDNIIQEKNYYWFPQTNKYEPQSSLIIREKNTAKLSIRVLGKFEITCGDKLITLKRKSSLRLLQYFITNKNSKLMKESFIDEIFPEGSFESINSQFYVALSSLRKSLEPDLKSGRDSLFIKQSGEYYTFCLDHIYLDIDEFTQLIQKKEDVSYPEHIQNLKKAELLYRGDYFEEYPYVHFLELERERFRMLYLNILQELAHCYWQNSDFERGMEYFERMIGKDPYRESIYEDYIKRLLEANLFLRAKKVSEMYQKFIEKELGTPVQDKLQIMFKNFSQSL